MCNSAVYPNASPVAELCTVTLPSRAAKLIFCGDYTNLRASKNNFVKP